MSDLVGGERIEVARSVISPYLNAVDLDRMAAHCPYLKFNITATAGFYSQLAGVLAGFAFTALMFLAATRVSSPNRGHVFADAIRILIAAFLSLVLTSLDYAIFAGQPAASYNNVASEEPIVGVGFAVSGALLIYAIILTLDAASKLVKSPSSIRPSVGASTRHLLAAAIAPLLMYYILQAVQQDYEVARYGGCHGHVFLDYLGEALLLAQFAVSWFGYPLLVFFGRRAKSAAATTQCAIWISRLLLTVTFGSAIAFALVQGRFHSPDQTAPPIIPAVCLSVMFLSMAGMTWQLAYTGPTPRRKETLTSRPEDSQELDWRVNGHESRLLRRIRLEFREPWSSDVFQLLSTLENGSGGAPGIERLQAAVLLIAQGDYHRFRHALSLAQRDWRGTLELAGLQNDDWMARLNEQFGPENQ
jgi:hypothetical protein